MIEKLSLKPIITPDGRILTGGGDQSWFDSELFRKKGCGVAAAANIFAFLSAEYPSLYQFGQNFSKNCFKRHMEIVGNYIHPTSAGVLPGILVAGIKRYAKDRGVLLRPCTFSFMKPGNDVGAVADFAAKAIRKGKPPIMLIGFNKKLRKIEFFDPETCRAVLSRMTMHWVTVISVEYDRMKNQGYFTVATWGGTVKIDIRDYMETFIRYMVYFEEE